MTTTTPAPRTTRLSWPRPAWAVRSMYVGNEGLDHMSRAVSVPATAVRPAIELQLVRMDRVVLDGTGVRVTPGPVRVELAHLDVDLPVVQARAVLAGDDEALAALDALLGHAEAEAGTCTRCGCTPDQLYPSYDGRLCGPCAVRQAEPGHGLGE